MTCSTCYGTSAGTRDVADALRPLLREDSTTQALETLERDFLDHSAVGPRRVAEFLFHGPDDAVQADGVGLVGELLRELGES